MNVIAGSAPRARRKRYVPATNDQRPTIRVVAGEIERIVDDAEFALIASDRGLYQRDGKIVGVVNIHILTARGREVGAQSILERGDHALLEDLATTAQFVKFDARAKGDVAIDPPLAVARTLRQRTGRLRFPILMGIVNAPTLRPDGSILSEPGYDELTGLLFDPLGADFPAIPSHPTREDARAALALLDDLIGTFPFVGGADRSVALSAILTALIRRSLPTAPMHAFSAPVAGSGKSSLVDIASIIATGHEAAVISQGTSDAEMDKRLGAALLAGDPIISIDNCETPLGGELLCQMLSQTRVRTRVLGQSATPELTSGAFIAGTGNNLTLIGDVTRRALLCSLDPKCERPETRVFDRDPIAAAKSGRPRYVAAALTLIRAFHVAGRRSKAAPLGSFEVWSNLVRGALLWLGCADPVDTMEAARNADPRRAAIAAVIAQWRNVIGAESVTVSEIIERATARVRSTDREPSEYVHPDFREALLTVAGDGGAINGRRLGNWLRAISGRLVDGARIDAIGSRQNSVVWLLAANETP